jgi:hypothetical protein
MFMHLISFNHLQFLQVWDACLCSDLKRPSPKKVLEAQALMALSTPRLMRFSCNSSDRIAPVCTSHERDHTVDHT